MDRTIPMQPGITPIPNLQPAKSRAMLRSGAASTSKSSFWQRGAPLCALLACLALAPLAGCARQSAAALQSLAQSAPTPAWIETQLFFGLGPASDSGKGIPSEGTKDVRWREFLDTEVTPRFPSGFTVVDA